MVGAAFRVDAAMLATRAASGESDAICSATFTESLNSGLNVPLNDAAHADLYRFMALELTEDKSEGHRAWRERRKPKFTGR